MSYIYIYVYNATTLRMRWASYGVCFVRTTYPMLVSLLQQLVVINVFHLLVFLGSIEPLPHWTIVYPHYFEAILNDLDNTVITEWHKTQHGPLTRYAKLRVAHAPGRPGTFSLPPTAKEPLVSDPGMHHGTCVTHLQWCVPESLTRGRGENVPDIPGACATGNFAYLVRGPLYEPCAYLLGCAIPYHDVSSADDFV